ncbi:MAG: MFS transporter [Dysgonamonadaceae bacterium]|nr:MFS transporter [Dysgonamonadaceae bacterium]
MHNIVLVCVHGINSLYASKVHLNKVNYFVNSKYNCSFEIKNHYKMKNKLWTKDFTLITSANLLMAIAFYFMVPILPVFLSDNFSATEGQIGLVLSFYTVAALLVRPFAGYALDTIGRYSIYVGSLLLFSIIFFGYVWATSILFVLVIRFMHGLTWGSMSSAGSTIAVDLVPQERRGEGIGIFGLSMTIAMAIGPLIAIAITGDSSYKRLFFSAAAFSFIGLILALFVRIPKITRVKKKFNFSSLIERKSLPVSLNMLLVTIPYGGIISFIALYGRSIDIDSSGLFFLLLAVGITISRIFSGKSFDRVGPKKISILGLGLIIVGLPILAMSQNYFGYHLSALILGFGFGIIMATFQAIANHNVEANKRGAANSTYLTFFDLGIGLGMLLVGYLIQVINYSGAFVICGIIEVIALIVFVFYTLPNFHHSK